MIRSLASGAVRMKACVKSEVRRFSSSVGSVRSKRRATPRRTENRKPVPPDAIGALKRTPPSAALSKCAIAGASSGSGADCQAPGMPAASRLPPNRLAGARGRRATVDPPPATSTGGSDVMTSTEARTRGSR